MSKPTNQPMTPEARRAGRIWGAAIIGGLAFVVIVNFYVMYLANQQKTSLVAPDYYQKALQYDEVIAAGQSADAQGLALQFDRVRQEMVVLRKGVAIAVEDARMNFYRPSDADLDFQTTVSVDTSSFALKPKTIPPARGLWEVTLVGRTDTGPISLTTRWFAQ